MIRSLKVLGTLVILAMLTVSVGRLWIYRDSVQKLFELGPAYIPRPIDHTEDAWFRPLPREEVPLKLRKERAIENSDKYFNPELSWEQPYHRKIRKHNSIAKYLTATRRHDPQYVEGMRLLAVRGFGVLEWLPTCNAIINYQLRSLFRQRQESLDADNEVYFNIRQGYDFYVEIFAGIFGMVDHQFFRELLAVKLEVKNREPILGFPGPELEIGDEFFTDEDWMTPEIIVAKAEYKGPPREEWSKELRDAYAQFRRRSRVREYGHHLTEKRAVIQDLIGFGLLEPEELEGVEVVESNRW